MEKDGIGRNGLLGKCRGHQCRRYLQVLYRTSGVPYVRVSTAQLGIACLLGLGLLTVQGTCGRKRLYTHVDWVEYLVWKSYFRWRCRRYHRHHNVNIGYYISKLAI